MNYNPSIKRNGNMSPVQSAPTMTQMPQMSQMSPNQPQAAGMMSQMPMAAVGTAGATMPCLSASGGELPPQSLQNPAYTPGFLKTQIGKKMRIEFLIGTTMLTDRVGTLLSVGASFVLLQEEGSNNTELCDLYSIKFVHIYGTNP
jgi:hypothetical protein